MQQSFNGEETDNPHKPAAGKDKAVSRANEDESGIWDSGTLARVGPVDFILPRGEEHGGLLTETRSERDGPNPTLIPAKDPSSATAAAEKANTSHVCPHCHREFTRLFYLNKHAKLHSRPYKCAFQSCKNHDRGWPTARDLKRHVIDKHSATPRTFACAFQSCTYESKRESNYRQHIEKKHGWAYLRNKSAGKQLGSQQTTEYPIQPSKRPLERLYINQSYADITRDTDNSLLEILGGNGRMQRIVSNLNRREDIPDEWWAVIGLSRTLALDASGSKAGLDISTSNFDTESLVVPSAWNEERTTNDSAAPASNAGDDTVQSQETNSELVVEELSDFTDGNTEQPEIIRRDAVEDQDSEHLKGNSSRHPEKLPFERAEFGRLQFNSSSDDCDVDIAEYQEFLRKQRGAERRKRMNNAQIGRRTISEVLGSESDVEDLGLSHARDPRPSARRLRRRAKILATALSGMDAKKLYDKHKHKRSREHSRSRASSPTKILPGTADVAGLLQHDRRTGSRSRDVRSRSRSRLRTGAEIAAAGLAGVAAKMLYERKSERDRGRHRTRSSSPTLSAAAVTGRVQHYGNNRSQSRSGRSRSRSRLRTGEIAAAALAGLNAKKLYDDGKSKRGRERSASAHRRAAAKEVAQRLDWFYPGAAHGTEDSNTSDLESIMSEAPSIASSRSSVPVNIDLRAVQELRTLLLTNEALIPLYDVAISKVGPEKFYRNFKRLLLRYGRALGSEATSSVQLKAARFVRFAASRVSMQIKENISNKDGKEQEKGKQNAKALGDYLKQMQDVDDSSTEDSEHDPEEASLQTLESVKSFMLSSTAFSDLCHSLRVWLGVESQNSPRQLRQ